MIDTTLSPQVVSKLSKEDKQAYDLIQNVFSLIKIGWTHSRIVDTLSQHDSWGNIFNREAISHTVNEAYETIRLKREKERKERQEELNNGTSVLGSFLQTVADEAKLSPSQRKEWFKIMNGI
jgi:hypothetical protein